MKLNVKAMALTCGIFWAVTVLIVASLYCYNGYGTAFIRVIDSIYPGYDAGKSVGEVAIGTAYAFVDGLVGGAIFTWIYNKLAR